MKLLKYVLGGIISITFTCFMLLLIIYGLIYLSDIDSLYGLIVGILLLGAFAGLTTFLDEEEKNEKEF